MTLRYDTRSRVSTYTQSWLGGEPDFGAYESISTITLSANTTSVSFSNIPQTYKHLQLRGIARNSGGAAGAVDSYLYFNTDTTGTNYYSHQLYGTGAAAGGGAGNNSGNSGLIQQANGGTASVFGAFVLDILDYTNTNTYKTTRCLGGVDSNTSNGFLELASVLWNNTAAINKIVLLTVNGSDYMQYSQFALYGIKG